MPSFLNYFSKKCLPTQKTTFREAMSLLADRGKLQKWTEEARPLEILSLILIQGDFFGILKTAFFKSDYVCI